jgi:FAD-dependent urate hydroxylase
MSMAQGTELLVIGAGPYGLSVAANAQEHGIETVVLGRPMDFWRTQMPAKMCLRSGTDWHLDAAGVHTFEAFLEERRIAPTELDPIPLEVFVDYTDWFRVNKRLDVSERMVVELTKPNERFEAVLESGERIAARWVVAAPGIRHFATVPSWAAQVPRERAAHASELVHFDELAGTRVLIVGGRQSAYEWAALIGEAGAKRIDIVHRHRVPRFERVSWKFADAYVEETLRTRGWWRRLPQEERDVLEAQFWEVGRLTLEWWLTPRLVRAPLHQWPGTQVVDIVPGHGHTEVALTLSNGERLTVDRIVFATGYKADITKVPYLHGMLDRIEIKEGFPVLDESFGTSVDGFYVTGFAATHDFGPVFGFVKGSAASATIIVEDVMSRRR